MAEPRKITVFGGTGFLGRRIVRHLRDRGFAVRIAARHAPRGDDPDPDIEYFRADIGDADRVAPALRGAWGAVNAVSLYVERGALTFQAVHVAAAARLAALARREGVTRLVHLSGLGADAQSSSSYIRSRGQGEAAVRQAFAQAVIIRPSVMFGPDDAFLTPLKSMLEKFPVFPLFGRGGTRLQPNHVEDVADAVARILAADAPAPLYEFGGPRVFSYREILATIARRAGARPFFVPVPFSLWSLLARVTEWLPNPPITRNQIALMRDDNVASQSLPGFAALGIAPRGIETELPTPPPAA